MQKDLIGFLLSDLRPRPGMFLTKYSLTFLNIFLSGVQITCWELDKPENYSCRFFGENGFIQWSFNKYNLGPRSYRLDHYLEISKGDEVLALDLFFGDLEYLINLILIIKPMELLGHQNTNPIYYFSSKDEPLENLPKENWICLGIVNKEYDVLYFNQFVKHSIYTGLLEFKAQGSYSERLRDSFDMEVIQLEVIEDYPETNVLTAWYDIDENGLGNTIWSCLYAQILPEGIDLNETKVVCAPFDGLDYKNEIISIIERLNSGWVPPDDFTV